MKFNLLLHVFTLVSVALVGISYGVVTPEAYWKSVLPNSPMPKAIKDLLYTPAEWTEEKNTAMGVNKGGVSVNTGKPGKGTNVDVRKGGVSVDTQKPGKETPYNKIIYLNAANADQLKDNANVALFFLEKDLHQGTQLNFHFTKNTQKSIFLPRKVADSIPFSLNETPQIFKDFLIKPDSMEAELMKQTLSECENKGIEGEEKYCATSMESMVDFSTNKLGKKVKAFSTEVNAKKSTVLQKYTIVAAKKLAADKALVCHKQNYAYAVFYCHKIVSTQGYSVSLVGVDGTTVKAVAVCHKDTGKWNPKHLAFQVLKVKPGSVPICHFLTEDNVVWVPY